MTIVNNDILRIICGDERESHDFPLKELKYEYRTAVLKTWEEDIITPCGIQGSFQVLEKKRESEMLGLFKKEAQEHLPQVFIFIKSDLIDGFFYTLVNVLIHKDINEKSISFRASHKVCEKKQ